MAKLAHYSKYFSDSVQWTKYRDVMGNGSEFVRRYVKAFSSKESPEDLQSRKEISYCCAYAKSNLLEIRNAIFQRLIDIVRSGGPESYRRAVSSGVDGKNNSMNSFIGVEVLTELLAMQRVGVYIDKPEIPENSTKADSKKYRPYVYMYPIEQILNATRDEYGRLVSVLLEDCVEVQDPESLLVTETKKQYRHLKLTPEGVIVTISETLEATNPVTTTLKLTQIPFVIFEITQSLLADIADHQIALTNMASSDIAFALKANYPFLTKQQNPLEDVSGSFVRSSDATEIEPEVKTGSIHGQTYAPGTDRPGFIHPSPEPLIASMQKQAEIKEEVRLLINLSLTNTRSISAESKNADQRGKEEGLSAIGLELEHGERVIANIWAEYENEESAFVQYPSTYSLKTDRERREEAKELNELLPTVPSLTFQKEVSKRIARVTIGHMIPNESLEKIYTEIDQAEVIVTDPEIIKSDHEAGFVGTELASKLRGYPEGEVEKAAEDHAERAMRIAAAQSAVSVANAKARGVDDMSNDPKGGQKEKKQVKQEKSLE